MNNIHFSSKTDLWETPQDLFDQLNARHHFTLDVCATPENAKCASYYTKAGSADGIDGLTLPWKGRVWCNPPYGREIGKWVRKAVESSLEGTLVVCLLPSRTDTAWWHDYVIPYGQVKFLRWRLKFGGHKNSAPFPSCIVTFVGLKDKKC